MVTLPRTVVVIFGMAMTTVPVAMFTFPVSDVVLLVPVSVVVTLPVSVVFTYHGMVVTLLVMVTFKVVMTFKMTFSMPLVLFVSPWLLAVAKAWS